MPPRNSPPESPPPAAMRSPGDTVTAGPPLPAEAADSRAGGAHAEIHLAADGLDRVTASLAILDPDLADACRTVFRVAALRHGGDPLPDDRTSLPIGAIGAFGRLCSDAGFQIRIAGSPAGFPPADTEHPRLTDAPARNG